MTLIMLVFIIGLAATAYLVHELDSNSVKIERDKKTAAALAEAKTALMGRVLTDSNHPGAFPCPDSDGDGIADVFSGNDCPSYLGRFPWKSLGTGMLLDGDGELLWYAMSSNYRDNSTAEPINGTSQGILNIDGVTDNVAIIFAPGSPLSGQTGRPSNTVQDYLDGENSDGDADYSRQPLQTLNDKLVTISRVELVASLSLRILREIRGDSTQGMKKFYTDSGVSGTSVFPYADNTSDGNADPGQLIGSPSYQGGSSSLYFNTTTKNMLLKNGWFPLITYTVSTDQQVGTLALNGKTLTVLP